MIAAWGGWMRMERQRNPVLRAESCSAGEKKCTNQLASMMQAGKAGEDLDAWNSAKDERR